MSNNSSGLNVEDIMKKLYQNVCMFTLTLLILAGCSTEPAGTTASSLAGSTEVVSSVQSTGSADQNTDHETAEEEVVITGYLSSVSDYPDPINGMAMKMIHFTPLLDQDAGTDILLSDPDLLEGFHDMDEIRVSYVPSTLAREDDKPLNYGLVRKIEKAGPFCQDAHTLYSFLPDDFEVKTIGFEVNGDRIRLQDHIDEFLEDLKAIEVYKDTVLSGAVDQTAMRIYSTDGRQIMIYEGIGVLVSDVTAYSVNREDCKNAYGYRLDDAENFKVNLLYQKYKEYGEAY